MTVAIVSAIPEEVRGIVELVDNAVEEKIGVRTFIRGKINGVDVIVAYSNWGKVASAIAAAIMIYHYNVSKLIFIGSAGSLKPDLQIGDIIIGKRVFQHDFNPSPLAEQFELPVINKKFIAPPQELLDSTEKAIKSIIPDLLIWKKTPRVYLGDIATGDQLFTSIEQCEEVIKKLPDAYSVDMESGAVAQVCAELNIPCLVIRGISDDANDTSSFIPFLNKVWRKNSQLIIKAIL